MAPSLWKGLVGIGLFALAHAAFSAAQHRSYMRLTEKEDESLPIDIVLQTLLAFAVTCYGIVHIAGEFKDMDATSELKNKHSGRNGWIKKNIRSRASWLIPVISALWEAEDI
ncbi:ER membrane protein complex subunit 5 isoform X2 [Pan paniscus]|uniref:ER membrane protein complex subunit 5 isoform X2 n=1 Tax=Pan paniscus TaxID=9597 RepID=UPI0030047159